MGVVIVGGEFGSGVLHEQFNELVRVEPGLSTISLATFAILTPFEFAARTG